MYTTFDPKSNKNGKQIGYRIRDWNQINGERYPRRGDIISVAKIRQERANHKSRIGIRIVKSALLWPATKSYFNGSINILLARDRSPDFRGWMSPCGVLYINDRSAHHAYNGILRTMLCIDSDHSITVA